MSRITPAPKKQYEPLFGPDADTRAQVFAQAPALAQAMVAFTEAGRKHGRLDARLIELVRLRVSFFNQCRSCMATRYDDAIAAGLTEDLVCSLEKPAEAADLTDAERVALEFAERFATDHLSITDELFDRLRRHFSDGELMELSFRVASFVGFGRMTAILDIATDALPERFRGDGILTPWGEGPTVRAAGVVKASANTAPR